MLENQLSTNKTLLRVLKLKIFDKIDVPFVSSYYTTLIGGGHHNLREFSAHRKLRQQWLWTMILLKLKCERKYFF